MRSESRWATATNGSDRERLLSEVRDQAQGDSYAKLQSPPPSILDTPGGLRWAHFGLARTDTLTKVSERRSLGDPSLSQLTKLFRADALWRCPNSRSCLEQFSDVASEVTKASAMNAVPIVSNTPTTIPNRSFMARS